MNIFYICLDAFKSSIEHISIWCDHCFYFCLLHSSCERHTHGSLRVTKHKENFFSNKNKNVTDFKRFSMKRLICALFNLLCVFFFLPRSKFGLSKTNEFCVGNRFRITGWSFATIQKRLWIQQTTYEPRDKQWKYELESCARQRHWLLLFFFCYFKLCANITTKKKQIETKTKKRKKNGEEKKK